MAKQRKAKISIKQVQQDITDRVVASLKQGHTFKTSIQWPYWWSSQSLCRQVRPTLVATLFYWQ